MKKMLLLLMVVGLFAVMAVGCGGSEVPVPGGGAVAEPVPLPDVIDDNEDLILDDESDMTLDIGDITLPGEGEDFNLGEGMPEYLFATGEIESIEDVNGMTHVLIVDAEGKKTVLVLSDETLFPFSESFEVGDTVTGWYLTFGPAPAIEPPMYNIAVFAAGVPDDKSIKVDRFHRWEDHDEFYMISQDGMLAFNVDENTEIILEDGQDFSDFDFELNRRMIVIYGISTRGIPALATAERIIVLFETAMALA